MSTTLMPILVNEDHKIIVVQSHMKPVIKKIEFSKAEQEEIDKINRQEPVTTVKTFTDKKGIKSDRTYTRRFTFEMARKRLRELYSGICLNCGAWPVYIVSRDVGDKHQKAKLIERYCESCYSKYQERISK